MAKAITGKMDGGGYGIDSPDHKGSVIIEWPLAAQKQEGRGRLLPSVFLRVYDEDTGRLIPAASVTVRAALGGTPLITADVAVYLDGRGEIIYDEHEIAKSDGVPATFPFLVAEMRVQ
jgi:hypothetical protein